MPHSTRILGCAFLVLQGIKWCEMEPRPSTAELKTVRVLDRRSNVLAAVLDTPSIIIGSVQSLIASQKLTLFASPAAMGISSKMGSARLTIALNFLHRVSASLVLPTIF